MTDLTASNVRELARTVLGFIRAHEYEVMVLPLVKRDVVWDGILQTVDDAFQTGRNLHQAVTIFQSNVRDVLMEELTSEEIVGLPTKPYELPTKTPSHTWEFFTTSSIAGIVAERISAPVKANVEKAYGHPIDMGTSDNLL